MHTHNLSQHVHRTGFHFPSAIVATVCMDLGLYLTTTGKVVPIRGVGGNIRPSNADQITINTEARDALRDLFPNIPDNDLNQIIKTAFQKVRGSFAFINSVDMTEDLADAKLSLGPAESWHGT